MAVIEHRLLRDLEERFRRLPQETPLAKVIDELFNEDERNQLFEEQDAIDLTRPTPIVTGRLLVLERLIKEALAAGVLTATDAANDQRSRYKEMVQKARRQPQERWPQVESERR